MNNADTARKKIMLAAPVLLLCERKDIAEFISSYRQFLIRQGLKLPELQIINLSKITEIPKFLSYLEKLDGFSKLEKVRIFVDAGKSTRTTQLFLEGYKNKSFLRNFADYKAYLFPGKSTSGYWTKGYLEDLLLRILKRESSECAAFENLLGVTEEYLLSANGCRGVQAHLNNHSRHVLYAYFAGTEQFVGLSMGELIRADAFELENSALDQLKLLFEEL